MPLPHFQCHLIGMAEWHTIYHLSYPGEECINDHIPKDPSSLQYVRIDDAINILLTLGRGTFMAKMDLKSAFRPPLWVPTVATRTLHPSQVLEFMGIVLHVDSQCMESRQTCRDKTVTSFFYQSSLCPLSGSPIPHWHSAICMQSSSPRQDFSTTHDQPYSGVSTYLPQQGILLRYQNVESFPRTLEWVLLFLGHCLYP